MVLIVDPGTSESCLRPVMGTLAQAIRSDITTRMVNERLNINPPLEYLDLLSMPYHNISKARKQVILPFWEAICNFNLTN
jgi:hypothetical protein